MIRQWLPAIGHVVVVVAVIVIVLFLSSLLLLLGHYLRAQSQGHHTIDGLEERGIERGSAQRSSLRGQDRLIKGHRQSARHMICLKGNTGETPERPCGAHMGFLERKGIYISSWTGENWTELLFLLLLSLLLQHSISSIIGLPTDVKCSGDRGTIGHGALLLSREFSVSLFTDILFSRYCKFLLDRFLSWTSYCF